MASGKITKQSVGALGTEGKQHFLWDISLSGFGVRVSPGGVKSYIYQYRLGGRGTKERRTTLGRHGEITPDIARKLAHQFAEQVRGSVDPVDARRAKLKSEAERGRLDKELAFESYCANYLDAYVRPERPRSLAFTDGILRNHAIPSLGRKPLPSITRRDILTIIDQVPANQAALRRNVFSVMRKLFNYAKGREDITASPMDGMNTPPTALSRDRVLNDSEVALTLRAAECLASPFGPFFMLLFATGQRREEAAGLNWGELDKSERLWTLPRERTKNGEPNLVPLNEIAMTALDTIATSKGNKDGCWPSTGLVFTTTGKTPISGYSKAKQRLDDHMLLLARADAADRGQDPEAIKLSPWRLHDARRTLATGLQRLGTRFEVTEAVLNHTSGASRSGVAAVYQRHNWAGEKRTALDAWGKHLKELLDPAVQVGNIVLLRGNKA